MEELLYDILKNNKNLKTTIAIEPEIHTKIRKYIHNFNLSSLDLSKIEHEIVKEDFNKRQIVRLKYHGSLTSDNPNIILKKNLDLDIGEKIKLLDKMIKNKTYLQSFEYNKKYERYVYKRKFEPFDDLLKLDLPLDLMLKYTDLLLKLYNKIGKYNSVYFRDDNSFINILKYKKYSSNWKNLLEYYKILNKNYEPDHSLFYKVNCFRVNLIYSNLTKHQAFVKWFKRYDLPKLKTIDYPDQFIVELTQLPCFVDNSIKEKPKPIYLTQNLKREYIKNNINRINITQQSILNVSYAYNFVEDFWHQTLKMIIKLPQKPQNDMMELLIVAAKNNRNYRIPSKIIYSAFYDQNILEKLLDLNKPQINKIISAYQKLSPEFIEKHKDKLDMEIIKSNYYVNKTKNEKINQDGKMFSILKIFKFLKNNNWDVKMGTRNTIIVNGYKIKNQTFDKIFKGSEHPITLYLPFVKSYYDHSALDINSKFSEKKNLETNYCSYTVSYNNIIYESSERIYIISNNIN